MMVVFVVVVVVVVVLVIVVICICGGWETCRRNFFKREFCLLRTTTDLRRILLTDLTDLFFLFLMSFGAQGFLRKTVFLLLLRKQSNVVCCAHIVAQEGTDL